MSSKLTRRRREPEETLLVVVEEELERIEVTRFFLMPPPGTASAPGVGARETFLRLLRRGGPPFLLRGSETSPGLNNIMCLPVNLRYDSMLLSRRDSAASHWIVCV